MQATNGNLIISGTATLHMQLYGITLQQVEDVLANPISRTKITDMEGIMEAKKLFGTRCIGVAYRVEPDGRYLVAHAYWTKP